MIDDCQHPIVYLHGGYDGIFPIIEEQVHGKEVGESLTVKLQPEDAFGEYDDTLVVIEPISLFPENIEVGMAIERVADEDDEEEMLYHITDIADGKVVLDGNHPLAGVAIVFSCSVADVRAATAEELAHGHVHGDGGHHH